MILSTKTYRYFALSLLGAVLFACNEDDPLPELEVPDSYTSANFESNTTAEATVLDQLDALADELNAMEASNSSSELTYPDALESVTLDAYAAKISVWLDEAEKAAGNNFDLENAPSGEGGILGTRLLDEYGLELEQMIEKGSFGAALYNHALDVLSEPATEASIDQLVRIFGAEPSFSPDDTRFAATYAKRRSDNTAGEGFLYNIENSLITAKAAIAAGPEYNAQFQNAIVTFLLNWEASNFATVIFYANATKDLIRDAGDDPVALGNAMHAYSEAVGFTEGWKGLEGKRITDEQIDQILALLLAEDGETPESYRFLKEPALLDNMDQIIDIIQGVYGFSEEDVASFYVNN